MRRPIRRQVSSFQGGYVRIPTIMIGAALVLTAPTALIVTSAGPARSSKTGATTNFTMAIVTDIGSLQDRSFNQLANEGRIAVGKQLNIKTRAIETHSAAERIPNALTACRQGYKMIF